MLEVLQLGKEKYGYVGIKAEFEAEGTRMDEMIMLSQVVRKAGLNLGIKIGGCEAVSDLLNTRILGADYIIAPMVETPYALSKYIQAKNSVYSKEEREDVRFLFNLETITAYNNLDEMIKVAVQKDGADGIVFGRVDFVGSMGFSRDKIVGDEVTKYVSDVSKVCRDNNLDFVVGGAVSGETIDSVKKAQEIHLSRFETRKVIFDQSILSEGDLDKALENAVYFELLWLQNKQEYYGKIAREDSERIEMLEERFKKQQNS